MKHRAMILALAATVGSALGCGGTAIDLERPAPPDSPQAGAPPVIVSEKVQVEHWVTSLSADDMEVYWVDSVAMQGKLRSCTFHDCAGTSRDYADTSSPVFVTSQDFFFPSPSVMNQIGGTEWTLLRCPKSGCNGVPAEFVNDAVGALNADATSLYWASDFDIYRCPLSGCRETPDLVAARPSDDPSLKAPDGVSVGSTSALLLASDSVYWISGNVVYTAAKDGSRKATRVMTIDTPYVVVAIDELNLYWVDSASKILSCPLAHCSDSPGTPLVTTGTPKDNLYVDGRGLYWREYQHLPDPLSSAVYFCPLTGCSEPRLLTDAPVRLMAFSEHYLYWTKLDWTKTGSESLEDSNTAILRVPKPTP